VGVQPNALSPCCYCVYTVVEGNRFAVNLFERWWLRWRQLYGQGVRGFFGSPMPVFIPAAATSDDAKQLLAGIRGGGNG